MSIKTITVKEEDWETSRFKTKEWESRVNIVRWEHDFENGIYKIDIKVKK